MSDEISSGKHKSLEKIRGVVEFRILLNGKQECVWTIDLRNSPGKVFEGKSPAGIKVNSTVTIEDERFVKLCLGELDPIQGFMSRKFKVQGDILMMQKLNTVLRGVRKSVL
uniref:SCP2 domain-containing protein n=1 Tax=Caenorhabditis japonica TaxID=281687 RepID=A0A8R1E700_CAEJA